MTIKVIITWDIASEQDQEYFEFVIGEFIPGIQRLGFQPVEAWATIYGEYPQIQVGMLAADITNAYRMLNSNDWNSLKEKLAGFIRNYSYKV
ncbi:MAG: hypothetical protein MUP03_01865, partial [Anaerolineales bacterium]|nr:hypothetical protein [Anaerolineales bacterium]